MIGRFHHLGHTRASGAQLRYPVTANAATPIAATGFAGSAWALQDRDTWIGWDRQARKARSQLVVGNPRFFVAPPVRVAHLASHLPGTITARLRADRPVRYGYQPALVETLVEAGRHRSTCYQAAKPTRVGQTNRRGKLDRYNTYPLPIKDNYLHPLVRNFRRQLTAALHPS